MGRGWFICGGSSKDTVPRPPLRESEGDEVKKSGDARKSWPPAKGEGSPPRAEGGASPVNAYWWTRKVLAENEVDLDDDDDLADGKSRVVFTSVGSC